MVDYNAPLYQHPQQTWDAKKCEKLAKRRTTDGMGTPYPFKGYLHLGELGHYAHGISVRYNGGCVRDGEWWQGEEWPLPKLAEGFEIVTVPTWGYRIIKTPASEVSTTPTQILEHDDESGTSVSIRMVQAAGGTVEGPKAALRKRPRKGLLAG